MLEEKRKQNKGKRALAVAFTISCLICSFLSGTSTEVQAADKKLTMKAARSLALQNSTEYENAEDKVLAKQSAYDSAVKAIGIKEKNMKTFRWSPLLNFKFPTTPNFSEASEFQYKPIALSYEIKVAQHKMQDQVFATDEKVNNLYCEIVVLQKNIDFNSKREIAVSEGLARNEAKLRLGEANKADIDKLYKKKDSLNKKIAADRRTLEADLKKLSKMVGMDVTTGYVFETPFVEASIDRSMLDALISYTLDRDETYYEACVNEITGRAELTINSDLVKNKYGADYNIIRPYINTALNGIEINKKAFKASYKEFIEKIDSYWEGKKKILFFKFPKLWFKGDMDGTRYIDDDPNALETNALDYVAACTEKAAAKETLIQSVTDTFNNYISVRNSYKQFLTDVEQADKELNKALLLNRTGELSFEEYDSQMDSYEELQNNMLDAMKLYTTTLYSFDRLTCGGISSILTGTDADMQTAVVGESFPVKNTEEGAYYTLVSIIQNMEFELSVYIPDDIGVDVTDYELWVDGIMVGNRNPKEKKLRHLALTKDSVSEAKIRLYSGDDFVDDCMIDPSVESGPLTITTGYDIKKIEPDRIGTYELIVNDTGIMEITFKMDSSDIKKYKVLTEDGIVIGTSEETSIEKAFKHINAIRSSLGELKLEFYGESGEILYKARFDTVNSLILKEDEN
ncbi:MAG: hypothetical protein J5802_07905 [Butyrivibrio sp.]|nr:hypothetical protein [Butyrivibrio sp.]